MLTLDTMMRVIRQARAYGAPLGHHFGGPEPDNYPMNERILRERVATSPPITNMNAHIARRHGRRKKPLQHPESV